MYGPFFGEFMGSWYDFAGRRRVANVLLKKSNGEIRLDRHHNGMEWPWLRASSQPSRSEPRRPHNRRITLNRGCFIERLVERPLFWTAISWELSPAPVWFGWPLPHWK